MNDADMKFKDALVHYGIPGMKWGVRRDVGSDGRVKKAKTPLTPEQRRARAQAVGALAAVGMVVAAEIFANSESFKSANKNRPAELGPNRLLPNGWPTEQEMRRR